MKCCICGKKIEAGPSGYDGGNNPWPYDKTPGARCCDECNMNYVIPARLQGLQEKTEVSIS